MSIPNNQTEQDILNVFDAYFKKTIVGTVKNYIRNEQKRNRNEELSAFTEDETKLSENIECFQINSITDFIDSLENPDLFKNYNKLTERQKEVIYMSFAKDMTSAEIAEKLGVSGNNVRKLKRAALNHLKNNMRDTDGNYKR